MGPWFHSQVNRQGWALGPLQWNGDTTRQFRHDVLLPFFNQYLVDGAPKADTPPVMIYNTGANHWDRFSQLAAELRKRLPGQVEAALSCRRTAGSRSTRRRPAAAKFTEYVSDPAKPVPFSAAARSWPRRRRLAHLAGARSALCRRPARRAHLCHRSTHRAAAARRRPDSASLRLHQRHRQRLGGEADRRLSRRRSLRRRRWAATSCPSPSTSSAAAIAPASSIPQADHAGQAAALPASACPW